MIQNGSYEIHVQTADGQQKTAILSPASIGDMPDVWWFSWPELWSLTDFDCQNIIKLSVDGQVWGLLRYGLYPYPGQPVFLEVEQIEANPLSRGIIANRRIRPIGKWLIWYAIQIAFQNSLSVDDDTLVILTALASDFDYYRNSIQMECLGPLTIAPGEEGYVFRLTSTAAAGFCRRLEEQWGIPHRI